MPLVNSIDLLNKARQEKYAVPAFNIVNFLTTKAVIEASREKKSPLIIQTSQSTVEYYGAKPIFSWANSLVAEKDIPVVLHLDHGTKMNVVKECVDNGWTSIMIDASKFSFEENIRLTKEVVQICHPRGISVEGELGHIGGVEDHINVDIDTARLTEPNSVVEFFEKSDVDSLAVAIGTAHGLYKAGGVKLDFERLHQINLITPGPLVLHGCSDIPREQITKLIQNGASKINISTEIKIRYEDSLYEHIMENRKQYNPLKLIESTNKKLQELFSKMIDWSMSANKGGGYGQ